MALLCTRVKCVPETTKIIHKIMDTHIHGTLYHSGKEGPINLVKIKLKLIIECFKLSMISTYLHIKFPAYSSMPHLIQTKIYHFCWNIITACLSYEPWA